MPIYDGVQGSILESLLQAIVPGSMGTPDEQLVAALGLNRTGFVDPAGGYSDPSQQADPYQQTNTAPRDLATGRPAGPMYQNQGPPAEMAGPVQPPNPADFVQQMPAPGPALELDPYKTLADRPVARTIDEAMPAGVSRIPPAVQQAVNTAPQPGRSKAEIIMDIIGGLAEVKRGWDMGGPRYLQAVRQESMQDQLFQRNMEESKKRREDVDYDRRQREWQQDPAYRQRQAESEFALKQRQMEEVQRSQRTQRLEEGKAQGWSGDTLARYVLGGQVPREDVTKTQFEESYWPAYRQAHPEATVEQAWAAYNQAQHVPMPNYQLGYTEEGPMSFNTREGTGKLIPGMKGVQKSYAPTADAFDQGAYKEAYDLGIKNGQSPTEAHKAALAVGSRGHAGARATGAGGVGPKPTASLRTQAMRTAEKMALMDVIDQVPGGYDQYTKQLKTPDARKLYKERYDLRFNEEWTKAKQQIGVTGGEGGAAPAVTKDQLLGNVATALEKLNQRIEAAKKPTQPKR